MVPEMGPSGTGHEARMRRARVGRNDRSDIRMKRFRAVAIAFSLMLSGLFFASESRADSWNKKTIITVNQPISVAGTVLQPGKYVMKLLDSPSNRHIVQIFNEDESRLEATINAMPNYRIRPS